MNKNQINKNKIAFLLMSFRAGGGERNILELAKGFADFGYDINMLVVKPVGQYAEHVDPRIKILDMDAGRIIFALPKIISYLKKERPKIILATDEYTHLMSLISSTLAGGRTKVVLRVGNIFSILFKQYKRRRDKLIPFLAKIFFKRAYKVIAVSHGVAEDFQKLFKIDSRKIEVINSPKRLDFIKEESQKSPGHPWLEKKDKPVILAVGRLRFQKDFEGLIRAFAEIKKEIDSRLIILGVGREQKKLEQLVKDLNIEDFVSLPGFSHNPFAYMARCDVFILSSRWEGLPNTILEAMACGAPVIATDCNSGPREILAPGTNFGKRISEGLEYVEYGVLVPIERPEFLREAIKIFLSDGQMRGKYVQKSRERSLDFDAKKIFQKYKIALGL